MERDQAIHFVCYYIDDTGANRTADQMPLNARLVGWQCGFEPMVVAVWSYLNVELDNEEAEELARDYLIERRWFSDRANSADFII